MPTHIQNYSSAASARPGCMGTAYTVCLDLPAAQTHSAAHRSNLTVCAELGSPWAVQCGPWYLIGIIIAGGELLPRPAQRCAGRRRKESEPTRLLEGHPCRSAGRGPAQQAAWRRPGAWRSPTSPPPVLPWCWLEGPATTRWPGTAPCRLWRSVRRPPPCAPPPLLSPPSHAPLVAQQGPGAAARRGAVAAHTSSGRQG